LSSHKIWTALCGGLLLVLGHSAQPAEWYPLQVESWTPPFNTSRQHVQETYVPLDKASKRWNLCVSIPHLKDDYWLAVNYGLVDEARRLGVNLAIYEAGGYEYLDVQRQQLKDCITNSAGDVDGLIVSAIAADGLNGEISAARSRGLPVLDLINGINSPDISARTAVDFYDMGSQIGQYLRAIPLETEGEVGVAWFPGPEGAGWVAAGDAGFRAALADSPVKIIVTKQGDTGMAQQSQLIESVLDEAGAASPGRIDYIVGTAVTAEAAMSILRSRGLQDQIKVLSYYYGPGVHKGIRRGSILAAPTDSPVLQARMAVDTMVRILENKPYSKHAAPQVIIVDQANMQQWNSSTTLAPRGFRAIFTVRE
jgi:protein TorT